MIYLDHAATTPLLPEVKTAMSHAYDTFYANASSLHTPGHLAHNEIEKTRELLAKIINADPTEIIFTSGSTESNNTVINTFKGQNIAVSAIEHESILNSAKSSAKTFAPIDIDKNGKVCYNKKIWTSRPSLISIMLASNEIGTINDLKIWSKNAHSHHAFLHSDMTQALGKIPIDVKELGVDYATFSAHKIGGPLGVGALYAKKGVPFTPFLIGGSQEQGRRAGTYNTPAIVGFKAALEYLESHNTPELYATQVAPLRDALANEIKSKIKGSIFNTPLTNSLPNILNISFPGAEGESIQLYLDAAGIIVSTGSACAASKPSHVLNALTKDPEIAHSSIRFSLGLSTTRADIDTTVTELRDIIKKLRDMSTI